jgi:purine-binding chemotaxis protein CheW
MGDAQRGGVGMEFVVFDLHGESYAVDINMVQEILRTCPITEVPNTPESVEGVMNLRGNVVPVLNTSRMFGLGEMDETVNSRILIVGTQGKMVGMMVDAVTEVLNAPGDSMEPLPSIIATGGYDHLQGVIKSGDRLIKLMEVEGVVSNYEPTGIESSH